MRELTDQQRLFLIESEQILTAWREARRQKQAHQYGMKWVRAADHEYLVRLDPRGCAALHAAQAADGIRRPVVAGAKRPRQQVITQFPPIYHNPLWLTIIII